MATVKPVAAGRQCLCSKSHLVERGFDSHASSMYVAKGTPHRSLINLVMTPDTVRYTNELSFHPPNGNTAQA